jgi:putative component of toxin-antitoxin plasmid stabilization module
MAALFVVPEGSAFLKYGLKVGKPVQLMGSLLDGPLQKEVSKLFKDRNFVKQIDSLMGQVQNGNLDPCIGTCCNSFNGVNEFRHKDGARIYFTLKDNVINILGYSNKSNQTKGINAIKKSL